MEILKILLSSLLQTEKFDKFLPIFNLLKDNSFDIKQAIKHLNPEVVAPLIKDFLSFNNNNSNKNNGDNHFYGISPILDIADRNIVLTLNKYFKAN